ncbi:hypothetical protein TNCV_2952721 [Trichonephila clavipes]|nr:hypothetical protein TNCV_2952721 [Trichonephila clavipes]
MEHVCSSNTPGRIAERCAHYYLQLQVRVQPTTSGNGSQMTTSNRICFTKSSIQLQLPQGCPVEFARTHRWKGELPHHLVNLFHKRSIETVALLARAFNKIVHRERRFGYRHVIDKHCDCI